LRLEETAAYIRHRMAIAGANEPERFANAAIRLIHERSEGLPRRINILCHKSLMLAYARGSTHVELSHAMAAADDERLLTSVFPWHRRETGWLKRASSLMPWPRSTDWAGVRS
jgi:MSHA biogenesis protein MshM